MSDQSQSIVLNLTVNAQAIRSQAVTLGDLVVEQGHGVSKIATAVNGDFVPARARGQTQLRDGDRIEIVSARQGG
jgi:sulfur carrier protein